MKKFIFYPFLIGLYPFFNIYAANIHKLYGFSDLILPMAVTLLATGISQAIFYFIWKDAHRAAFITLVLLFLFFSYGHIYDLLKEDLHIERTEDKYLLPMWGFALLIFLALAAKWGKYTRHATEAFTIIAVILLVFPMFSIMRQGQRPQVSSAEKIKLGRIKDKPLPDIYYIVLDAYPREDVLREFYDYDNHEFTAFLENAGFYVAQESQTNYPYTNAALASSLNMNYVDALMDIDPNSWNVSPLNRLIQENVLCSTLRDVGYYYIIFDNAWEASSRSQCADSVRGYTKIDELDAILLQTTVLRPFIIHQIAEDRRKTQLFILEELGEIAKLSQPTLTFAHVILPHPPFIFDREGNWPQNAPSDVDLWLDDSIALGTEALMLDQTIFTTKKVKESIQAILENSETPPVIVLQSDHGPYTQVKWAMDERFLRERMPILNAYYLPENGTEALYPSISPVNSFRVVLNHYFDAKLDLLEDKHYYAESLRGRFYQYVEITSFVYGGEP